VQQAHRIRADAGRSPRHRSTASSEPQARIARDGRRLLATVLSLIVPGAGQLLNGRPRAAALFFVPPALVALVAWLLYENVGPTRLAAWAIPPDRLALLLNLNIALVLWRLAAAGHAFFDRRYPPIPGRNGVVGGLALAVVLVVPHWYAAQVGRSAGDAFSRVFAGGMVGASSAPDRQDRGGVAGAQSGPVPGPGERINVLLIGVDTTPKRGATLTDTMIVASLDPVGKTISMVSIPRDTVSVPLGDGDEFGPKVNSLYAYAERHPDRFPQGPERALEDALGALLDVPIHYYARVDFDGFMDIIDAVGGVDVKVKRGFSDPDYDGIGLDGKGFSIEPGRQHLTGGEALAYARVRKAAGQTDFSRAARQQQILVALKNKLTKDGSIFWSLPKLLDAVGGTITTDIPIERLPDVALVIDDMKAGAITRVVIQRPLVKPKNTRYGASQVPRLKAIRAMAKGVFSEPGTEPLPWPTPEPTEPAEEAPAEEPGGN
jgi:LCP family protein required for cell wall assembly